jgi:spore germination protein (amino acid permease)
MENDRNIIYSKQLITFVVTAQISVGILYLPSALAIDVGHDGWITVLLSGILYGILISLLVFILKRFDGKSLIEINKIIYGKYLSTLISLVYIAYSYFGAVISLRSFAEIVRISVLKLTPLWAYTIIILTPAIYMAWYGLKAILRYSTVTYIILIFTIILYLLSSREYRIDFILPIGASGVKPILKSTIATSTAYIGPELIFFFYSDIKNKSTILKHVLLGNLITTLFYTITVLIGTLYFGEQMLMRLVFPLLSFASSHKIFVFERLDFYFISFWLPCMGTTMLIYFFCTYYGICKLVGIPTGDATVTNKWRIILLASIFILAVPLSMLPKDTLSLRALLKYLGYGGLGVIILTAVSYLISLLTGRGALKNDKLKDTQQ